MAPLRLVVGLLFTIKSCQLSMSGRRLSRHRGANDERERTHHRIRVQHIIWK